jgi:acyl-CoA hydrolase
MAFANRPFPFQRRSAVSELHKRIRRPSLHDKIMAPEETIPFFKNGMDLGWSGFTPVGYPKVVPAVLADYLEKNALQGKMRFNLSIGTTYVLFAAYAMQKNLLEEGTMRMVGWS